MPNHVTSCTKIWGADEKVKEFMSKHWNVSDKGEACLDFDTIVPMPELLKKITSGSSEINGKKVRTWIVEDGKARELTTEEKKQQLEIGSNSWYDWSIEHWGTKWNSYSGYENCVDNGYFEFTMDTAWSFPVEIFRKLHEMYPELEMETAFFDEGWNFAGVGKPWNPDFVDYKDEALMKIVYERVYGCEPEIEEEAPDAA